MGGITPAPRSFAARRHNAEQSLRVLRKRPNLSIEFLFAPDALARGEPAAVLGLLQDLRRAYGPAHTPVGHARAAAAAVAAVAAGAAAAAARRP